MSSTLFLGISFLIVGIVGIGLGILYAWLWRCNRQEKDRARTEAARDYFREFGGKPGDFLLFPGDDNPVVLELRDDKNGFSHFASHVTDGITTVVWSVEIISFFRTNTPVIIDRHDEEQREEYQNALRIFLRRLDTFRAGQASPCLWRYVARIPLDN